MSDPIFFPPPKPATVADVCSWTGATVADERAAYVVLQGVGPLDTAGPGDLTFLDNKKYVDRLATTKASACLVHARFADKVPEGVVALVTVDPYRAFAAVVGRFYPAALKLEGAYGETGIAPGAHIHPSAHLEPGVTVEPGAVIGARAEIGTGSVIGAGAVIGHDVRIGRNCHVAAAVTLIHCLLGNRVIIHSGTRVGQDGFGFAMGPKGHQKVPQIGRVVIQDDVEIGANCTIDRGANRDTVIGEGTKIDNLVQIAHNVVVGRHCVIVSHVGISGSTELGDFVVLAGQAGIAGHLKIGSGAQIGAQAGVMVDVAPGARIVGSPAKPVREFAREIATLKKLARRDGGSAHDDD
ncbi:MAG: UDP-3-O-(3-hydroxymyristoyl)glucosamine N-acyltransferase [Siculibacillus sp.]|nr:UDP-3-O-(3-hydroxymyristoyl)glucosamine N-acyltransferase [Siculibacillus sp.]